MVHGSAHERQAERYVDRRAEAGVLGDRQALIVIHGQHRILPGEIVGRKGRVRRPRTGHARIPELVDGPRHHVTILAAQFAILPGMRVEAQNRHSRTAYAKVTLESLHQNLENGSQALARHGARHRAQGNVGGSQRHPQRRATGAGHAGQHHHRHRRAAQARQVFRVSHEIEAGLAHDRLVDRSGHQRVELPAQATRHAPIYGSEHCRCVAGIGATGNAGMNKARGRYAQSGRALPGLVRDCRKITAQHFRALAQHPRVGKQHGVELAQFTRRLDCDVRPDSGRFADADREPGACQQASSCIPRTLQPAVFAAKAGFPPEPCALARPGRRAAGARPRLHPASGCRNAARYAIRRNCVWAR